MLKFQKFPDFPLGEFDGFDDKTGYQMVPVRDRREIGVVTEATEMVLRCNDPSVAKFANFRSGPTPLFPGALTLDQAKLPPRSRIAFSILGSKVGNTEVVLEKADGSDQTTLLISVKEKKLQRVNLCFLRDIRRSTRRPHLDAQEKMKLAAKTFLQQANIELTTTLPPEDVVVAGDLGNPIRTDKPGVLTSIIAATPARLFGGSDILVYSVWDASDNRPSVGITHGNLCFIDDQQLNDFEAALTFAHEIGHALGLGHNGRHVLMAGDGISRTSKLSQFEIDTINRSGTVQP
jgi:hypothetical protein